LTSGWVEASRIPTFLPCDRDAILIGLRIAGIRDPKKTKIVLIKNTLEIDRFQISEALKEELDQDDELGKKVKVVGEAREIIFDILGNLAR
jgi:hypothetical protein